MHKTETRVDDFQFSIRSLNVMTYSLVVVLSTELQRTFLDDFGEGPVYAGSMNLVLLSELMTPILHSIL